MNVDPPGGPETTLAPVTPLVRLERVSKSFGPAEVVRDVDLEFRPGEVHALVGANGSGKSTLMKMIYGYHRPTKGNVIIRGEPVSLRSPGHALHLGISAVPQEIPLVPALSATENLLLGHLPSRFGVVSGRSLRQQAHAALSQVDPDGRISAHRPVMGLELASQQLVAIARALAFGASMLVFDEPTSSLSADAVQRLFRIIRELKQQGKAIAFVSQRLDDIFSIADRIAVLRDGSVVARATPQSLSPGALAEEMAGPRKSREWHGAVSSQEGQKGNALLVDRLLLESTGTRVSFGVNVGEVVGLAGLPGSGVEDIVSSVYGRTATRSGSVLLFGHDITGWSIRQRARAGLAYLTGDRRREGLMVNQTVDYNLSLGLNSGISMRPIRLRQQRRQIREVIDKVQLVPPDPSRVVGELSGGNQQKVVLGRWLLVGSRVWLLNDATRGVDIHTRDSIHRLIREQSEAGAALMTSSDMQELVETCDRILVVRRGEIVRELRAQDASEHVLLAIASGAELSRAGEVG